MYGKYAVRRDAMWCDLSDRWMMYMDDVMERLLKEKKIAVDYWRIMYCTSTKQLFLFHIPIFEHAFSERMGDFP